MLSCSLKISTAAKISYGKVIYEGTAWDIMENYKAKLLDGRLATYCNGYIFAHYNVPERGYHIAKFQK